MTFESVYEMFTSLDTVRKQRFWTWFSGVDLNSYWTENQTAGSATFSMNDSIDGGFNITGGGGSLNNSDIDFNDIRQYSPTGSVCILVAKRDTNNVNNLIETGLYGSRTGTALNDSMIARDGTELTFKSLFTRNASVDTTTASDVPVDLLFTNYKMEINGVDTKLTINGVLKVTTTSTQSTAKMQPVILGITGFGSSGTFGVSARYLEAFNT